MKTFTALLVFGLGLGIGLLTAVWLMPGERLTVRTPIELSTALESADESERSQCWAVEIASGFEKLVVVPALGIHPAGLHGGIRVYRLDQLRRTSQVTAGLRDAVNAEGDEVIREGSQLLDACIVEFEQLQAANRPASSRIQTAATP